MVTVTLYISAAFRDKVGRAAGCSASGPRLPEVRRDLESLASIHWTHPDPTKERDEEPTRAASIADPPD